MLIRFCVFILLLAASTASANTENTTDKLPIEPITPQALKQMIDRSDAPLLMVHAWATWCMPCREEFPEMLEVYEAYADDGLVLLLVSADDDANPEPIRKFLQEMKSPVGSRVITELSEEFINTLSPELRGALPATVFFRNGERIETWEGKRSRAVYEKTLARLLNRKEQEHD